MYAPAKNANGGTLFTRRQPSDQINPAVTVEPGSDGWAARMNRRGVFALYYGLAVLCGALYAANPHFLSASFIAGFLVACAAIQVRSRMLDIHGFTREEAYWIGLAVGTMLAGILAGRLLLGSPSAASSPVVIAPSAAPIPTATSYAGCYELASVQVEVTVDLGEAPCTASSPPSGPPAAQASSAPTASSAPAASSAPVGAASPKPGPCDPSVDYCNFKARVMLNQSSSGSHIIGWTLRPSENGATVDLAYSYRCPSGSGHFIIDTYPSVAPDEWIISEVDGQGQGTVENVGESPGSTRIQVSGDCSWTIKVTAKPDPGLVGP